MTRKRLTGGDPRATAAKTAPAAETRERGLQAASGAGANVSAEDAALALATLRSVMRARDVPGAAKAAAARAILEARGVLGKHANASANSDAPAAEVSLDMLDARIAALEQRKP